MKKITLLIITLCLTFTISNAQFIRGIHGKYYGHNKCVFHKQTMFHWYLERNYFFPYWEYPYEYEIYDYPVHINHFNVVSYLIYYPVHVNYYSYYA